MPVMMTVAPDASCVACPASGPVAGPEALKPRFVGLEEVPMYTLNTKFASVGRTTVIDPVVPAGTVMDCDTWKMRCSTEVCAGDAVIWMKNVPPARLPPDP